MITIRDKSGNPIANSKNLRGLRERARHVEVKTVRVDRLGTFDAKLCVMFADDTTCETTFADFHVCENWVMRWRNASTATIIIDGKRQPKWPSKSDIAQTLQACKQNISKGETLDVTIGANGLDPEKCGYQTGDNSYTGAAYHWPHWAVCTLQLRSNCEELATDMLDQLDDLWYQSNDCNGSCE